jgi:hypothetical protein
MLERSAVRPEHGRRAFPRETQIDPAPEDVVAQVL